MLIALIAAVCRLKEIDVTEKEGSMNKRGERETYPLLLLDGKRTKALLNEGTQNAMSQ